MNKLYTLAFVFSLIFSVSSFSASSIESGETNINSHCGPVYASTESLNYNIVDFELNVCYPFYVDCRINGNKNRQKNDWFFEFIVSAESNNWVVLTGSLLSKSPGVILSDIRWEKEESGTWKTMLSNNPYKGLLQEEDQLNQNFHKGNTQEYKIYRVYAKKITDIASSRKGQSYSASLEAHYNF
jgi:hypothetical protein